MRPEGYFLPAQQVKIPYPLCPLRLSSVASVKIVPRTSDRSSGFSYAENAGKKMPKCGKVFIHLV
jgi:hypothetical protein